MKIKWPFVTRKTYENLLADYNRHEDHYWRQAALNMTAQSRIDRLEAENKRLKDRCTITQTAS